MNATVRRYPLFAMLAISGTSILLGADPYSITISTPKELVKVGSEVRIEITLKNISDHEIDIPRSPRMDRGEQGNDVEVTNENGAAVPETKYYRVLRGKETYDDVPRPDGKFAPMTAMGVHVSEIGFTLKPGDTMPDGIILNRVVDLTHPGKYTIRIRRRDDTLKAKVASNAITVTLVN